MGFKQINICICVDDREKARASCWFHLISYGKLLATKNLEYCGNQAMNKNKNEFIKMPSKVFFRSHTWKSPN